MGSMPRPAPAAAAAALDALLGSPAGGPALHQSRFSARSTPQAAGQRSPAASPSLRLQLQQDEEKEWGQGACGSPAFWQQQQEHPVQATNWVLGSSSSNGGGGGINGGCSPLPSPGAQPHHGNWWEPVPRLQQGMEEEEVGRDGLEGPWDEHLAEGGAAGGPHQQQHQQQPAAEASTPPWLRAGVGGAELAAALQLSGRSQR